MHLLLRCFSISGCWIWERESTYEMPPYRTTDLPDNERRKIEFGVAKHEATPAARLLATIRRCAKLISRNDRLDSTHRTRHSSKSLDFIRRERTQKTREDDHDDLPTPPGRATRTNWLTETKSDDHVIAELCGLYTRGARENANMTTSNWHINENTNVIKI